MTAAGEPRPEVAVGGIAIDDAGRVLLIQRGHPPGEGLWTIPGGRVQFGESLRAACAREIAEETGLDVAVLERVTVVERIRRGDHGRVDYHYVIVDYLVTAVGGELRAGDDARDVRWVTPDELVRLRVTDGLLPVIARARELARPERSR